MQGLPSTPELMTEVPRRLEATPLRELALLYLRLGTTAFVGTGGPYRDDGG